MSAWVERPLDADQATKVGELEEAGYPQLLARLLALRGIDCTKVEGFFKPSLSALVPPENLPGVNEAAETIFAALAARSPIVVFGDYDCDGVSATAILVKCLRALGGNVEPFLPHRLDEGYGMTEASVARMLAANPGVRLVVSVDNGINAIEPVAELKRRGIAVVVTDHHLPTVVDGKCVLPAADAVVNPKVAAPPELECLCGAGVAFFLANRVTCLARERSLYSGPGIAGPLVVLAGLATVTDIMPQLGQNRVFVAEALKLFPQHAPVGLRELHLRAARSAVVRLTTRDFGFLLGPRINAAGRVASGDEALDLILCDDRERVRELAQRVDSRNVERKSLEQGMLDRALAQVVEGAPAQVIDLPDGHPGVAGIVAARLLERLSSVPVFVVTGSHGSARSPEGMSVLEVMDACSGTLVRYGGHAAAGGFSVRDGMVDEFRRQACAFCRERYGESAVRSAERERRTLDAWVGPGDLTLDSVERLLTMEPFGVGNPEPLLGLRGVRIANVQLLGAEGRHLRLALDNGLSGVWWGHGAEAERLRAIGSAATADVVFRVAISGYGRRHVELGIVDVLAANPEGERAPSA